MDTGRWRPCAYSLYRRTRAHHVYRHTDTSLLWTQTVMRKPLVLWTAVWMLLLRHISGRNYRNGYSKISSVNTREQPVGTAFVTETGNSKHPWLVHAPTMRVPLIIDGTDAVYNATRAALLAIFSTIKAPEKTGKLHLLHYLQWGPDVVRFWTASPGKLY